MNAIIVSISQILWMPLIFLDAIKHNFHFPILSWVLWASIQSEPSAAVPIIGKYRYQHLGRNGTWRVNGERGSQIDLV